MLVATIWIPCVCVCVCVRYCVLLTCLQTKNWPFASICAIFHHLTILQTDSTWMTQRFCHRNCCSQSRRHQRLSNFHPALGKSWGSTGEGVSCLEIRLGNDSHSSGCWDIYFPIGMSQECDKNKCFPKSSSGFRIFFVWFDATNIMGIFFLVKLKIRHLFVHLVKFLLCFGILHIAISRSGGLPESSEIRWKQMLGSEELNLGWALPVKHHWYQSQLQPDDWLRHLTVHCCTNKNITIYKEQSRYRVLACYLWFTCIFFALFVLCVVQCSVEALRICPYKYMYIFFSIIGEYFYWNLKLWMVHLKDATSLIRHGYILFRMVRFMHLATF